MKTMVRWVGMRMAWWGVLFLPACAPEPSGESARAELVRERAVVPGTEVPGAAVRPESLPVAARQSLRFTESRPGGILVRGVAFDARDYRLRVLDQEGGPGSECADAGAAARVLGGVAGLNAGFFTPEGEPLGLVVEEGKVAGVWNRASSLGSALWRDEVAGGMSIVRRSEESRARTPAARNLLQAGPLLVDRGRPVGGLDGSKVSARTFVLWDGGQRWWVGTSTPVSLAGLSRILLEDPPVGWKPWMALNLDGGRSSDLWVSAEVAGREVSTRLPWNRMVRNFLVLVPRG